MLLGKRPRAEMKKTTSMLEFAADSDSDPMEVVEAPQPSDQKADSAVNGKYQTSWMAGGLGEGGVMYPRNTQTRNSADFVAIEIAPYLRSCGLCNRELFKRDIYMYRGEVAFCSLECREIQIRFDERKEKRAALAKIKAEDPATSLSQPSFKF